MMHRGSCLLFLGLMISGAIAGLVGAFVPLPWYLEMLLVPIVALVVFAVYGEIVSKMEK